MVTWTNVVMAYFVIGAVMWGGGVLAWQQTGVAQAVIENPETGDVNEELSQTAQRQGNIVDQISALAAGPIQLVFNLAGALLAYLFWPITALLVTGAPMRITVLLGGAPTLAFYLGLIRLVRTSA